MATDVSPKNLKEAMDQLPPDMRARVQMDQGRYQEGVLKYVAQMVKGDTRYLSRVFKSPATILAFLNMTKVLSWQVVPDFQEFNYTLIYEVSNG